MEKQQRALAGCEKASGAGSESSGELWHGISSLRKLDKFPAEFPNSFPSAAKALVIWWHLWRG
jgi:hypothetical protein